MRLLHEIAIFQTVKSKVIISLFETVKLSVSLSLRNLYNSLNSIKESIFTTFKSASDFLFDPANTPPKDISPYIVVHLIKVFAVATTFHEFTFIVKLSF